MKHLIICALIAASAVTVSAQKAPKVRVYFWTAQPAAGALVGLDQQGRDDSVKDLRGLLKRMGGKRLGLATRQDESQMQIEVTERLPETALDQNLIMLTLRVREHAVPIVCRPTATFGAWRDAAQNCIRQIQQWTEANRAQFTP